MKKLTMVLCIVIMALWALPAFAGPAPGTGIVGSQHDMNLVSNPDTLNRVCAFCHTPHHALDDANANYLPLWSHEMTTQTFQPYDSVTLDALVTDVLAGPSRLCMSCHDGAIAVDQHYGSVGDTDVRSGDSWGEIGVGFGGDLINDHPIGFSYAAVAALDDEIRPETDATTNPEIPLISDLMTDGMMTCSSCHDVHNTDNNEIDFLVNLQAGSQICLTCHIK